MAKAKEEQLKDVFISNFKTLQQGSQHTSGPACIKMVNDFFSKSEEFFVNERQVAREVGALPIFGTSVSGMENYLKNNGFIFESSLDRMKPGIKNKQKFKTAAEFKTFAAENFAQGHPILVENMNKNGCWMVLVGYRVEDDVFVAADPSACNSEESYVILNSESFFEIWSNPKSKEEHLMQPYFVVKDKMVSS